MILRPVSPQSPSGPPMTNFPVGLTLVLDRHLALGIRAEHAAFARFAGVGEQLQDLVGIVERRRHELRRLAAGIAEHDALIARALIL
jgi:hypothetical protein